LDRLLSLDVGEKRIGIALSDPLKITAQGYENYTRKGTEEADIEYIKDIMIEKNVSLIVCGNPLNMNGSFGPQAEKVKEFGDKISKASDVPIKYWDERLTSREVERIMIDADVSRAKRKKVTDMLAAMRILQSYMDANC
jgi:putative holliday junction resolvase